MCQHRHTVLAGAAVAADRRKAVPAAVVPLREALDRLVAAGTINPWCGICGAPRETWKVDLGRTAFRTLEEATPALAEIQQQNLLAQAIMGGHPGPGKLN
jgi:hypothetical protein